MLTMIKGEERCGREKNCQVKRGAGKVQRTAEGYERREKNKKRSERRVQKERIT